MNMQPNTQNLLAHTRCAKPNLQNIHSPITLTVIDNGRILAIKVNGNTQTITIQHLKNATELIDWGKVNTKANLTGQLKAAFSAKQLKLQAKQQTPTCVDLHQYKYWILLSGSATVTIDQKQHQLLGHQAILLPPMQKCQLTNNTDQPLTLIQFESKVGFSGNEVINFE